MEMKGNVSVVPQKGDLNLGRVLLILWREKFSLLVSMVLFGALGVYYALNHTVNEFVSVSVVEFSTEDSGVIDFNTLVSGASFDRASLNTQIEVLESREVAQRVVENLNLTEIPEFNPSLRDPSPLSPEVLIDKAIHFLLPPEDAEPPTEEEIKLSQIRAATDIVMHKTEASLTRETYLFKIIARSQSPTMAMNLANEIATVYIELDKNKKSAAARESINWLTDRVQELEQAVRLQEQALRDFEVESEFVDTELLQALGVQAKEFRTRLEARQLEIIQQEVRVSQLQDIPNQQDKANALRLITDPTFVRLAENLDDSLIGSGEEYGLLVARLNQIVDREEANLRRMKDEFNGIQEALDVLQSRIQRMGSDQQELEQKRREITVSQELYQTFLTGLQEATVQIGLVQSNTSMMSSALEPREIASPNRPLIVILFSTSGFIFCALFFIIRQASTTGVLARSELDAVPNSDVIGEVSSIPIRKRSDLVAYISKQSTSVFSEAIRDLRTSLRLHNGSSIPQVIVVTSSIPGEGKTTVSVALAHSIAGLNKKVFLLEGDIRRQTLKEYFPVRKAGILDVISGKTTLQEAMLHDERLNIDVLGGQRSNSNPADVFSSEEFRKLISQLRSTYDHIIIDSPPVLVVPDARILSESSDALIYASRWKTSTLNQVSEGVRMFDRSSIRPLLVLTQVDKRRANRYYGGSYGHGSYYGSYGGKYYDA